MKRQLLRFSKIIIVNIGIFFVLVVITLGAVEGYLKLTIPSSRGGSIYEFTQDTQLYKTQRKNARILAWGVELRTNELGFRDNQSEVPEKEEGEYRIIVLGDSFTVSAGVEYGRIYTSLLESVLTTDNRIVRVINLAVGGYNIIQYSLVLEEVGLSLEPDLVLVAVFPYNDFSNKDYDAQRERATGIRSEPKKRAWYTSWYVYRAFLWKIEWRIEALFQRFSKERPVDQKERALARQKRETDKKENLDSLKHIAEVSSRSSIPAAVVILPNVGDFEDQRPHFELLTNLCDEIGIPCLSLLDPFITNVSDPGTIRLNAIDSHPSEKYHELVVEQLAPFVQEIMP